MAEKTCAACDCELGDNTIVVRIRGRAVEVCCEECAKRLKEAQSSAQGETQARFAQIFDIGMLAMPWSSALRCEA